MKLYPGLVPMEVNLFLKTENSSLHMANVEIAHSMPEYKKIRRYVLQALSDRYGIFINLASEKIKQMFVTYNRENSHECTNKA
jgi:hypothetical protein